MGICNVTPDSFSDGGTSFTLDAARARVDALLAEGADVLDIGGESTRPGAQPIPAKEQLARVLEVVRYASAKCQERQERGEYSCVSIDTTSAEVAAACLDAGASAVNDVSCLRDDELAKVAAGSGAALVLMHTRGVPMEMRGFGAYPEGAYVDIVRDVLVEWTAAAERAAQLGVARDVIVMDPGLGFGKSAQHSAELVRRIGELVVALSGPVLLGASRKSFLTLVDADAPATERIGGSIAAALHASRAGVEIVRVHDVRATRQAIDLDRLLSHDPRRAPAAEPVSTHMRARRSNAPRREG